MTALMPATQIVILGGTGDLSRRKLFPALLDLFCRGALPENFSIVGFSRRNFSNTEYRAFVRANLEEHHHEAHSAEHVEAFCSHISYRAGALDEDTAYTSLHAHLAAERAEHDVCHTLFYLAVPPSFYEVIFKKLHEHHLVSRCDAEEGCDRLLVEKPFGSNYTEAEALDKLLGSLYQDRQVFRIDHYLAKEAAQNILSFRFANPLLMPAWNKNYIESIHIEMHETIDVSKRGSFYDGIGTLRDVGANHLLQLLALIAMDRPASFSTVDVHTSRGALLQKIIPFSADNLPIRRAQYIGYQDTEGVASDSQTETYFHLTAELDHEDWSGVPFTISAGKALDEAKVAITVVFKDIVDGPFSTEDCERVPNKIILNISPTQSIDISINAKRPGLDYQLEQRTLSVNCATRETEIKNSYERVLLDCIRGEQMLFTTTREVLASWAFTTSILQNWDSIPLHKYAQGSAVYKDLKPLHE